VVSGIGLARFLPVLLLAPIGGWWQIPWDRRKIISFPYHMTMVAAGLGVLTITGVDPGLA